MHTAVIIGATGLVGRELCHICLEQDSFSQVVALTRNELPLVHKRLKPILINDFNKLESITLPKMTKVTGFCCLGTTMNKARSRAAFRQVDLDYVLSFARLCSQYDCEHLSVVSSMGASSRSPFFYSRVKGAMEQGIKSLSFKSASIVRPSLLLGQREDFRAYEVWAAPLLRSMPLSIRAIDGFSVAKAMVELAVQATPGTHIYASADLHVLADRC